MAVHVPFANNNNNNVKNVFLFSGKEDQTSFSLLSDLERHIGKTDEEVIVIVDSLNCLLYNSDLCRDINKISKQQGG